MNSRQKYVLLTGILLVGLADLFPPWLCVDQYYPYSRDVERFAGYSFLFAPPAPNPPTGDHPIATVSRIDSRRLTVEWAAILMLVVGLVFFSQSRPVPARKSERPGGGSPDSRSAEGKNRWSLSSRFPANLSREPRSDPNRPSKEGLRILKFLVDAEPKEFNASVAAVLQRVKLRLRNKERVYFWITQNRRRFAGIVFGGEPTDSNFEAAIAMGAKRLMPDIENYFQSMTWSRKVTFGGVAPHWAIAELSNEGVNLDALAQEGVDFAEDEQRSELWIENAPLLFLDGPTPGLPDWLPEKYGRRLSPVERVEWFDQLLRFYWQQQRDLVNDHPTSPNWPPVGDKNARLRELTISLYLMYFDAIAGHLPKPSFVAQK
jgi:hypothetical protein